MLKHFTSSAVLIFTTILSTGCVPNQREFDKQVHSNVYVGMSKTEAISAFQKLRMKCIAAAARHEVSDPIVNDGEPTNGNSRLSCSRSKQPALPSSCLEKADVDVGSDGLVKAVQIDQIICAGF